MVNKTHLLTIRNWLIDVADYFDIPSGAQRDKAIQDALHLLESYEKQEKINIPKAFLQGYAIASFKVAAENQTDICENIDYDTLNYLCDGAKACSPQLLKRFVKQLRDLYPPSSCTQRRSKQNPIHIRGIPINRLDQLFPALQKYKQIHLDSDATNCIFGKIRNWTVVPKQSASDSMVALGHLGNLRIAVKTSIVNEFPLGSIDIIDNLEYERQIYERIINKMIEQNYSPNFIYHVGTVTCSYDDLFGLLSLSPNNNDNNMKTFFQQLSNLGHAYKNEYDELPRCATSLIMEGLKNYSTYREALQTEPPPRPVNILNLLFQIIYTLLCMQKRGLYHHDLHTNNIAIEKDTSGTLFHSHPIVYVLSEKHIYVVNGRNNLVKIFDWDFGYHPRIGENVHLVDEMCGNYARCNDNPNRNFDIMHMISTSIKDNPPLMASIFSVLTKIPEQKLRTVHKWWGYGQETIPKDWKKLENLRLINVLKNPTFNYLRLDDNKKKQITKRNMVFFRPGISKKRRTAILNSLLGSSS